MKITRVFDRGRDNTHPCTFCGRPPVGGVHQLRDIGRYANGQTLTRPVCERCSPIAEAEERGLSQALGSPETPRVRDAIADRFGAGDSIAELAADYDITPEAVEACVRVERRADAAIVEAAERWNERALAVVESGVFALAAYELAGQELHRAVQAKRSALNK